MAAIDGDMNGGHPRWCPGNLHQHPRQSGGCSDKMGRRPKTSMASLLANRELNACKAQADLQKYAEDKAAQFELEEMVCKLPVSVRSTFLMCFSPNGSRVASTHGDHKIYVCQVSSGKLFKALEGHPRTPWCLAFHPTNNDLLASGCLGGEVRVWDLRGGGSEVWVCPEKSVITSLSFHPMGNFIALSTINRVHFWDWSRPEPFATTKTNSEREKVRLVRFSPQGDYLLTGIANIRERYIVQYRRSSILSRLMTMYHRLGEMLPASSHNASLQRRIARRGGLRRFSRDELHVMLRMRNLGGRQSALQSLHRPRSDRDRRRDTDRRNFRPNRQDPEEPSNVDQWLPFGMAQGSSPDDDSGLAGGEAEGPDPDRSREDSHPSFLDMGEEPPLPPHPTPQNQGETSELWNTFNRLRILCTRLESRMMRHSDPNQPSSSSAFMPEASTSQPNEVFMDQARSDVQNDISLSLVSLLSRLQESLQSFSEATALSGMNAARRQIREVRMRISEILERLENVSGYRERLRSLREQIYQAAERMARRDELDQLNGGGSGSQQWDLAYCLWLVDMSLRLTNQMQRILTADYRLSRFHLGRTSDRPTRMRQSRMEVDEDELSHSPSGMLILSSESESESEEESERVMPPTFTPPPFRAPQYNLPRFPTAGLGPLNAVTHRIQYWKTSGSEYLPQISDPQSSLVVSTCKIHNDGSVDVSPCGRLLVALVPDAVGVTLSVFSLDIATLGQLLYTWGFGPNAVSVSFSPLSRYVVVGLASSRYISPQREVVAQIFRLGERPLRGLTGGVLLEHVGNMSQPLYGANATHQLLSLNCVRWLPNPGEGLVYGTNRGTLCICRPLSSVSQDSCDDASPTPNGVNGTRRDSTFQTLSQRVEETATRHALLGRRS